MLPTKKYARRTKPHVFEARVTTEFRQYGSITYINMTCSCGEVLPIVSSFKRAEEEMRKHRQAVIDQKLGLAFEITGDMSPDAISLY
jgi:hypothetical protein